eukprot:TRINITY_DN20331_c1_g1_i1.p1 TRINITY_DN20331_c1_g1~~TRINITY_DN20331_c1_g1_i1.p1  ORF type:complete len:107 (-),score=7.45 TRINITY_DN20331_c1_g1_i1:350-670(-)
MTSSMVVKVDKQWRVTAWNHTAEELTAFMHFEVMGLSFLEFITAEYRDIVGRMLQQASCASRLERVQVPFYTKAGEKRSMSFSAHMISGNVVVEGEINEPDWKARM